MAKVDNPNERVLGSNNLIVTSYLDPITYNTTFSIIPAYDSAKDMYGYSRYSNVGTMIKDIDIVLEYYEPTEDIIHSENLFIDTWYFSSDKSKCTAFIASDFYTACNVIKNSNLYAYNINNTAHYTIFTIDAVLKLKEDHGLIDDIIASATSDSPYQIDIGWSFSSFVDKSYLKGIDAFAALHEITKDIVELSKANTISIINIGSYVHDQYRLYDNEIAIGEDYYILFKKSNLSEYKTLRITNVPETLTALNAMEYTDELNENNPNLHNPMYPTGTIDIDLAYFKDKGGFKNNPVCMILMNSSDGWFDESFNRSNLIFTFIK